MSILGVERKPQPAEENGLSSSECNQALDLQKLSWAKWDKAFEGPKSEAVHTHTSTHTHANTLSHLYGSYERN